MMNRHLLEVVHALLLGANARVSYWGETLSSATYLINRIPSAVLDFQITHDVITKAVLAL